MIIAKSAFVYALIVLLLGIFYVALAGIGADSLWNDEFLSLHFAGWPSQQLDFAEIFERIHSSPDHEAVTYYLMLALWAQIAGWSVFSARLLSLFFGLLAVVFTYRIGCDLRSQTAGFGAAVLLGASALLNVYLHETRMYSLWVLATVLLIWLYWRILRSRGNWVYSGAFALTLIATLFTHPLAIALIGALGLYHLLLARRSDSWIWLLFMFIASFTLYAPAGLQSLAMANDAIATGARTLAARDISEFMRDLGRGLSNGFGPFLLLPLLSLRHLWRDTGLRMLCCVGAAFLSVIVIAYLATGFVSHTRYSLPILPIFALIGGIALTRLPLNRQAITLVLGVWCVFGLHSTPSFKDAFYHAQHHDVFHLSFPFEELVSAIRRDAREGDAVVYEFPYHSWALQGVFDYYMYGSNLRYVLSDTLRAAGAWSATIERFERFVEGADRLYFVLDRTIEATDFVPEYERILGARFLHCGWLWDTDQARVDKFALSEAMCSADE